MLLTLSIFSLLLAWLSWRFVEMPFRDKVAVSRKRLFVFGVVGSAFFGLLGAGGHITNGFDRRTNPDGLLLADIHKKAIFDHGLCRDYDEKIEFSEKCQNSDEPEILVWGDSFAMHLVRGLLSSNPDAKIIQFTKSMCGPIFGVAPVAREFPVPWAESCLEFNQQVHEWIRKNKSVKYVVLSSPFGQYLNGSQILIDGNPTVGSQQIAAEYLDKTINELVLLGVKPILFSPPPRGADDIGACLIKAEFYGEDLRSCDIGIEKVANLNAISFSRELSRKHQVVSLVDYLCNDNNCRSNISGSFIYSDVCHLSGEGSAKLGAEMNWYGLITQTKAAEVSGTSQKLSFSAPK